jgi:hypothetical protein
MPRTRVVHVKKEPFDVYIGRAYAAHPKDSPLANPFKIGTHGSRREVIERYREYARTNPAILALLDSLRGKVLGCWCSPEACHGDVLVEMIEGKTTLNTQLDLLKL